MEDEYCPTCGQRLQYEDVTEECKLKWEKGGDKYLVGIEHQGNFIIFLGPECELHQPRSHNNYRIKEILKTSDGSGWWFQVLKLRSM